MMDGARVRRAAAIAALLAGLSLVVPPAASGVVGPRSVTTTTIAPGLVFTQIVDPSGPNRIFVLDVDLSEPLSMETARAGWKMGAYALTSAMAKAAGALAAVDGDYSIWPGRPQHAFADDGALLDTSLALGSSFQVRTDESAAVIQHETTHVKLRNDRTSTTFAASAWNTGGPPPNGIVVASPYGGAVESPPSDACSARLRAPSRRRWGAGQLGVTRTYTVGFRRCRSKAVPVRPNTIVLSAKRTGKGAAWIAALRPKDHVDVSWDAGVPNVVNVMGGAPMLVSDGAVVAMDCASYFCDRNPRTGVGITATGHVLLVVVDGRSRASVGMTIIGFAKEMLALGAVSALNLDGGGSATMWIAGRGVVNQPSDSSGERPLTNALVVLPGPATGHGTPAGVDVPRSRARFAAALAASDPASTGRAAG